MSSKILKKVLTGMLAVSMLSSSLFVQAETVDNNTDTSGDKEQVQDPIVQKPVKETIEDLTTFEPDGDVMQSDPLNGFAATDPASVKVEISTDKDHTTGTGNSMKINPQTGDMYGVYKTFPEMITGQKMSVWIYDDMDVNKAAVIELSGSKNSDSNAWSTYFGIKTGPNYTMYGRTEGAYHPDSFYKMNTIPRTEGWHEFSVDMSIAGEVSYYVDDKLLIKIPLADGEFGEFNKAGIINFWHKPSNKIVYVDDFKITQKAPVPTNPVIDDTLDTFDWTFAPTQPNIAAYEFSVDGGETFNDCLKKPLYIGNQNYGIGDIVVRAKAPEGADYVYPSISNADAFTFDINMNLSMERDEDLLYFNTLENDMPDIMISDEVSRSGLTSMKVIPDSSNHFHIGKNYGDDMIKNKVVTMWFYDEMVTNTSYYKGVGLVERRVVVDGVTDNKQGSAMVGVDTYKSKTHYTVRPNWGTTVAYSSVPRSKGWHSYQWDYTSGNKCEVYIDGVKVTEYDAVEFNHVAVADLWAMKNYVKYYDDITITDTREDVPVVPDAPTNPVTDDKANTFGWTAVEGKDDATLYEYSMDNGKTFNDCTANPQPVAETLLPEGTVIVRLKETDSEEAGMVLRNTERFTDPSSIVTEKITELVDFINCANPNDYTDESWAMLAGKIENAKTAIETEENLQTAYDELLDAKDDLVFDMKHEVKYSFVDKVVPVAPVYGTPEWAEDKNISYITEQSYKIMTETVDGNQIAQLKYTFPKAIEDKQIIFYYFDDLKGAGNFDINVGNSQTGYGSTISSRETNGNGYRRILSYDIINGEKTNRMDPGIRRRNDLHKVEINMTNGGVQVYLDTILMNSIPELDSIDYLEFIVEKSGTSAQTYISVDELYIRDKNAVTDIVLPSDSVDIGYYDTYEINHVNNTHVKPYEYDTTDKFTYKVADSSVAHITKGGSIQPVAMEGTTTATITSSNGVSKTITVNVKDYKVEKVDISDALVTQTPNFVDSLTMTPNTIDIVNAVITPEASTNLTKTWTSSDETVATVNNGEIKALKVGTTTITVTTEDGNKTDSIVVNVVEPKSEYGVEIFVAPNGDDINGEGTIENPFKTVERARDEARTFSQIVDNGAVIYFREGTYVVTKGIALEMQDSGNAENPVKYSAYKDEEAVFTGAVTLAPSDFTIVTDEDVLFKLQDSAKGKVYETDISEYLGEDVLKQLAVGYGGASYGGVSYQSNLLTEMGYNVDLPYYSVSFGDDSMTLSRWPNKGQAMGSYSNGFTKIDRVPFAGQSIRDWNDDQIGMPAFIPEEKRDILDSFEMVSNNLTERMKTWNGIPMDGSDILDLDIWYEGYTGVDYATQTSPIRYIKEGGEVRSHIACHYWAKSAYYTRFYVYNLIQELDIPGEWYIDKNTGKLYIMPPTGADMTSDEKTVSISMLGDTMFTLQDTSNITIDKVNLTNMLGGAFKVYGGDHNKLSNSVITNTSSRIGGVFDSEIGTGTYNGIEYCTVKDVNGGFDIKAAFNYETLEPGYNFVHGCLFDNYQTLNNGFNSAVVLHGVGNYASSNEICNSPNNALMWQGNDNVIEFNNIHHVDRETTDTSAIYTGRNTLNRGTVIKNNWIHHLGKTASSSSHNSAIYIDDVAGGIRIYDNVIEQAYWGIFINGGQDNYVTNNTFKDLHYGVVANDWSYCWLSRWYQHGYGLIKEGTWLTPTTVQWWLPDSPYAKYPHLQTIYEGGDMNDSIYNKVINNKQDNVYSLFNYMVREVQPNATNVIKDWFFDKNNPTV